MFKKIIFLICISAVAFGQSKTKRKAGTFASFDFIYGQNFLSHKTMDGQLNSISNIHLFKSIMYAGVGMTGRFTTNRDYSYDGHMHYTQIVPQSLVVNDTLKAGLTGFNLGLALAGINVFRKSKKVNLIVSLGFNTGRLRFYGISLLNQKNPYLCPKVSLTPRIMLGKICLQANLDCQVDVSKKNWRRTYFSDSPKTNLQTSSLTGLSAFLSVGYVMD